MRFFFSDTISRDFVPDQKDKRTTFESDCEFAIPTPRPAHRRLDGVDGRVDNHVVVGTSVEVVAALKVGDVTVAVAVLDLKRRKIDAENP